MLKNIGKIFTVYRKIPKWYKLLVITALIIGCIWGIHWDGQMPIYMWIVVPINYWILFGFNKQ